MNLISMANSAEEAKEQVSCESDPPKYPYGLMICLNDDVLQKLGIAEMPKVGSKVTLTARCDVCSISAYQEQGGDAEGSMSLQITDMALEQPSTPAEKRLYGGAKS